MDLKKLIDLFPYQYKERDTYKVDGKGILERFLEVCGTYLVDIVTPDIDNELDLIDLNNVPDLYLNYLWEFLGEIPFAYGLSIDKKKFEKYYNGLRTKEELIELSKVWTIQKKGPVVLSSEKVRSILKYAITLMKIRGTRLFFETLFRLYGFRCIIIDPMEEQGNTDSEDDLWYNNVPRYDAETSEYDVTKYDVDYTCTKCMEVTIDITNVLGFKTLDGDYFLDSQELIYCGKFKPLLDLYEGITTYNSDSITMTDDQDEFISENEDLIFTGNLPASLSDFISFRKMVESFFERYLPYNVRPHITYQGLEVDDNIEITVTQVNSNGSTHTGTSNKILRGVEDTLFYKINITSNWPSTDKRYQVGTSIDDVIIYGNPHSSDELLSITVPGTYYIRPVDKNYSGSPVTITVSASYTVLSYHLLVSSPFFLRNNIPVQVSTFHSLSDEQYAGEISTLYIDVKAYRLLTEYDDSGNLIPGSTVTTQLKPIDLSGDCNAIQDHHLSPVRNYDYTFQYLDSTLLNYVIDGKILPDRSGMYTKKIKIGILEKPNVYKEVELNLYPPIAYFSDLNVLWPYNDITQTIPLLKWYDKDEIVDEDLLSVSGVQLTYRSDVLSCLSLKCNQTGEIFKQYSPSDADLKFRLTKEPQGAKGPLEPEVSTSNYTFEIVKDYSKATTQDEINLLNIVIFKNTPSYPSRAQIKLQRYQAARIKVTSSKPLGIPLDIPYNTSSEPYEDYPVPIKVDKLSGYDPSSDYTIINANDPYKVKVYGDNIQLDGIITAKTQTNFTIAGDSTYKILRIQSTWDPSKELKYSINRLPPVVTGTWAVRFRPASTSSEQWVSPDPMPSGWMYSIDPDNPVELVATNKNVRFTIGLWNSEPSVIIPLTSKVKIYKVADDNLTLVDTVYFSNAAFRDINTYIDDINSYYVLKGVDENDVETTTGFKMKFNS